MATNPEREAMSDTERIRVLEARVLDGASSDPFLQARGKSNMGQAGPADTVPAVIPLPANKIQLQRNLYTGLPVSPNEWFTSGSVVIKPDYTVYYNWRTDVDVNCVATLHPVSELHG